MNVLRNLGIATMVFSGFASVAIAGPREQALKIFNRINGDPPDDATLQVLTALIEKGQLAEAALRAIDHPGGKFYNAKLKQMVIPWTNENGDARLTPVDYADALDYISLVIGMVRDEVPFDQLLYEDILYMVEDPDNTTPLPKYYHRNLSDNEMRRGLQQHFSYVAENENEINLAKSLKRKKQSEITELTPDQAAGVFTTRGFGKAYYNMGTNRAAFAFTMKTFLCHDMEELMDTSRSDYRIRRDVSRAPGGDTSTFRNKCAGCHTGMDALAGAFSYLDWTDDEGLVFDPFEIRNKVNGNGNETEFPDGYIVKDDTWVNLWNDGPNAQLGWRGPQKGRGIKNFGKLVSRTRQFSQCMSQRALQSMCLVDPKSPEASLIVNQLANSFEAGGYNMKRLFAQAVLFCRGS